MLLTEIDINSPYSYADYQAWTFSERLELINGRIYLLEPNPGTAHQIISREISGLLWMFLKGKPCQVISAPFDVRLPRKSTDDAEIITVVQPDICVVCDMKKIDKKGCLGAPDIIVEILSPSNSEKELKTKYDVYEEAGVKEYWVVFPTQKTMLIYTLIDGKYAPSRLLVNSDVVRSSVLPGFTLHLSEVFPDYEIE